jgi:hypothetical protein
MIAVPAGRFLLGANREPSLLALLCYIDRHPVTVAQFGEFLHTRSRSQRRELKIGEVGRFTVAEASLPATGITWHAAAAYAQWHGKRLPTELEWAIAAGWDPITGFMRNFPWGSEFDPQHSRCNLSRWLCPVQDFDTEGVSPLGCCDTVGKRLISPEKSHVCPSAPHPSQLLPGVDPSCDEIIAWQEEDCQLWFLCHKRLLRFPRNQGRP